VIAMSGAFSGDQVPDGVAADAFYEKGNGVAVLLKAIERLSSANRQSCEGPEPTWILRNGQDIKRAMPIQGRYPPDGNASSIPPLPIPIGA